MEVSTLLEILMDLILKKAQQEAHILTNMTHTLKQYTEPMI